MNLTIVRPSAEADIEQAYQWYESQRAGLGEAFLLAVKDAIDIVVAHPDRFPVMHRDTRRVLLRRFPYALYYRSLAEGIVVIACFHGRRDPERWHGRT